MNLNVRRKLSWEHPFYGHIYGHIFYFGKFATLICQLTSAVYCKQDSKGLAVYLEDPRKVR